MTNIFSSDIVRDKLRYENSNSRLIFNIEALKIDTRTRDLKELTKVKGNYVKSEAKAFFQSAEKI